MWSKLTWTKKRKEFGNLSGQWAANFKVGLKLAFFENYNARAWNSCVSAQLWNLLIERDFPSKERGWTSRFCEKLLIVSFFYSTVLFKHDWNRSESLFCCALTRFKLWVWSFGLLKLLGSLMPHMLKLQLWMVLRWNCRGAFCNGSFALVSASCTKSDAWFLWIS